MKRYKKEKLILKDNKLSNILNSSLYLTKKNMEAINRTNTALQIPDNPVFIKDLTKIDKMVLLYYLTAALQTQKTKFSFNPSEILNTFGAAKQTANYNAIEKTIYKLYKAEVLTITKTGNYMFLHILGFELNRAKTQILNVFFNSTFLDLFKESIFKNYLNSVLSFKELYKINSKVLDYVLILLELSKNAQKKKVIINTKDFLLRKVGNNMHLNRLKYKAKYSYLQREREALNKAIEIIKSKGTHEIKQVQNNKFTIREK